MILYSASYVSNKYGENGIGRLYSISNTDVTTTYEAYDKMGRELEIKNEIVGAPETSYTTVYTYDKAGRQSSVKYPDNYDLYYTYYPGTDLIEYVENSSAHKYVIFDNYEPSGKIGDIAYGNNTETSYTYDLWSTRLKDYQTLDKNLDPLDIREYKYSPAGDIKEIIVGVDPDKITYTYTYDKLHRLIGEKISPPPETPDTNIYTYTYAGNQAHGASKINLNGTDRLLGYDANGNMESSWDFTRQASRTITYNGDNMPGEIKYSGADEREYIYNGEGVRAKKINPDDSAVYYIGDHFEVYEKDSTENSG